MVHVITILEENHASVRKLCSLVRSFLKLDCPELKAKLTEAETVNEICDFINDHFASFLDCDIFEHILMEFGGEEGQKEWERYSAHLTKYTEEHKIEEFIKINPELLVQRSKFMDAVILKIDMDSCNRLNRVCDIKRKFADILDISSSTLVLLDIQDGCVLLKFLVPICAASTTFTRSFTIKQVKELKELSIQWIVYGDHYMDLIKVRKC